jgi:FtsH-binding integral membrane protein
MSQWNSPFGLDQSKPFEFTGAGSTAVTRFFNAVYAWMAAGLALTGLVAWMVSSNQSLVLTVHNPIVFILLFVAEIALVMVISRAINRINAAAATALFLLFAAINGLVLSVIFLVYAHAVLTSAFLITGGTFAVMSVWGMVTRADLTRLGSILYMALVGIIIASLVNFFMHSSGLNLVISYIGVLVFVGLTAYDTQKLKMIAQQTENDPALAARLSIVGSLMLYLDFINLFLFILRIMGDRRR